MLTRASLAACAIGCLLLVAGCGGSGSAGDAIVFVSSQDGDYAIFGMNADGSGGSRLTEETGDTSTLNGIQFQIEPAWSPDGTKIAFASAREGTFDLYVMGADGTGATRLTSTKENDRHPSWSPDGTQIAFSRSTALERLYVMNADGTDARRLTADDITAEGEPAWSPDGNWIAYTHGASGSDFREIWVVHPDGSDRRSVTKLDAKSYTPTWAPDSKRLAFASDHGGAPFDIFTVGVDGKGVRQLGKSDADSFEPAWSPDGGDIAFSRDGAIVVTTLASAEQRLTNPEDNDSSPAWKPVESGKEGS